MNREDLSPAVRRFVAEHIDGVEQLEILKLLRPDPSRYWNAGAVAREVSLTERDAERHLEDLARRGLLDVRIASHVIYRFSPATPALSRGMDAVMDAYRQHRAVLLAHITSPRRQALKDFSDAFRWRRDKKNG